MKKNMKAKKSDNITFKETSFSREFVKGHDKEKIKATALLNDQGANLASGALILVKSVRQCINPKCHKYILEVVPAFDKKDGSIIIKRIYIEKGYINYVKANAVKEMHVYFKERPKHHISLAQRKFGSGQLKPFYDEHRKQWFANKEETND